MTGLPKKPARGGLLPGASLMESMETRSIACQSRRHIACVWRECGCRCHVKAAA